MSSESQKQTPEWRTPGEIVKEDGVPVAYNVSNKVWDDEDLSTGFVQVLSANPSISKIHLTNLELATTRWGRLWDTIATNNQIAVLQIHNCISRVEALAGLIKLLGTQPLSIKELSLHSNMFIGEKIPAIIAALSASASIETLDISSCTSPDPADLKAGRYFPFSALEGEQAIVQLAGIASLRSVNFHGNYIATGHLEKFFTELADNKSQLETLTLACMSHPEAKFFPELGLGAVEALSEFLAKSKSITTLDLSFNSLSSAHGDAAIAVIADGLSKNASLKSVDLGYNQISDEGAKALLAALQTNKTLIKLDLEGNDIDTDILKQINHCLESNQGAPASLSTQSMDTFMQQVHSDTALQVVDGMGCN